MHNKTKLLIVDDHEIVRDGINLLLSGNEEIEVIADASTPRICLDLLKKITPEVILMDVGLPQMSGIELTRLILKDYPNIKILFLTANIDKNTIENCLLAGGKGFLAKNCSKEELFSGIKMVAKNKYFLNENIFQDVFENYLNRLANSKEDKKLSERENNLLRDFANGITYVEIAEKYNISKKTVETHRRNIFQKMNFKNITDLIKYAIKERIIEV